MKSPLMLLVVILALFLAQALGQTTNGLVTGAVTDPSGAVVAGAEIDVSNQETGSHRTTTSGGAGIYVVPQLPPGIYTVSAKAQGFAIQQRENIRLEVNQSVTLDFKMSTASVSQTVEVNVAPPLLNTTSATLTNVIGHQETVDLPLNGRQFTQLALLAPGVSPVQQSQQTSDTVALGAGGISPSVNGQRGEQNNFTMDGVLNNAIFTNVWALSPPLMRFRNLPSSRTLRMLSSPSVPEQTSMLSLALAPINFTAQLGSFLETMSLMQKHFRIP
jgi:hypothetical protein